MILQSNRSARELRRVVAILVVLAGVMGATIYWVGMLKRQSMLAELSGRLSARVAANADVLSRQIGQLQRDVRFLAHVPPVDGMVRASESGGIDRDENTPGRLWQRRLESIFREYVQANPDVFQVRLIGMADHGRELVRIERIGGQVVTTAPSQLQEKGETDYVRQASRLQARQVYVSEMNLNREHGQVQVPNRPTLRVATPVLSSQGKLFGIVVINHDANAVLHSLKANLPPDVEGFLINAQGDFLLHPIPSRAFGFDLGRRRRWQDEFGAMAVSDPWALSAFQRLAAKEGTWYVAGQRVALDAEPTGRHLTFLLATSSTVVEQAVSTLRASLLGATLIGALVVWGTGWLYTRQRRQLMAYQTNLSAIVESSHDAIIGKTLAGIVTSWNHGAERMFGIAAHDAIGKILAELIIPETAKEEEATILARIGRGEVVSGFNAVRCCSDGRMLDVSVTASPIKSGDGRVIGVAKTVRDISEQVAADARIRQLNASLEVQVQERTRQIEQFSILQRAILADASYAIIATDTDGIITLFNPAAERMLGYRANEMLAQNTPAIFHDHAEIVARAHAFSIELGQTIAPGFEVFVARARRALDNEFAWTYVRKDGSRFPVLLSVSALRADDGSINGFLGIASDITRREQDQRDLLAARDQLLNAADVAQLGIWRWTLADDTLVWNERMRSFYGIDAQGRGDSLHFDDWRECIHPDDVTATLVQLHEAIAGRGRFDTTFRVCHADGQVRTIQAAASIERDGLGQAVRVIGINRDITVQRDVEATLRSAKAAAESANTAKSEFLANMSHEIRSPMNAVLGMLMLLKQTRLDPRQLDYASKAEVAGRTLLGILNDILDFSRVEAGKLTLDHHPFSLDRLLRDAAVILSANVGDKTLDILYQVDPALPDFLVGDALRLQQVVLNLAGNAIKFTEHGEVVLSIHGADLPLAEQAGAQPAGQGDAPDMWLEVSIRDTGIGISEAQCQRIFEGFSQAEASTARRYGGSGLGLAISERLVRLMGGSLSVESTPGVGSTFRFRIACQRGVAPPDALVRYLPVRNLTCLIVDAHAIARELMVQTLTRFGWAVTALASGADALALLEQTQHQRFDVILVDWRLAEQGQDESVFAIRRHVLADTTAFIAMVTGQGREALVSRWHGLIDAVLVKPVTASMVWDVVVCALSTKDGVPLAQPVLPPMHSSLSGLHLLVVDDNVTNQQVARELLSHEGARVSVADNGQSAIDAVQYANPPFDCVLMDIQMPDMDGYAATRRIREQFEKGTLPIIAMTANALATDRACALQAGMNDHVGKPFELAQLVATLLYHTGRTTTGPVAQAHATGNEACHDATPNDATPDPIWLDVDSAAALVRFGGHVQTYRAALRTFVGEARELMASLPDQRDQVVLAEVRPTLHALKGLAGTVGAQSLFEHSAGMEAALRVGGVIADWEAQRARLFDVCQHALRKASELGHEPGDRDDDSGAILERVPLRAALTQLQTLLVALDLDALACFARLHAGQPLAQQGALAPLEQAIEQCDFVLAAQLCRAMLADQ